MNKFKITAIFLFGFAASYCQPKTIKLQLPGDTAMKDYYVFKQGNKYLLNGDIEIPVTPGPNQIGVVKQFPKPCKTCPFSVTIDDDHGLFTAKNYKWPDADIPIEIDPSVYQTNNCDAVKAALDYMNTKTLLHLYPRKSENDFVSIAVAPAGSGVQGGSSPVGKQGGKQTITMIAGQFNSFSLVHELMHAAGVFHEQSRQDRDNYISIDLSNVKPGLGNNFQIEGNSTAHGKFDFCSIMIYNTTAFAIDPSKPVIRCGYNGNYYTCPACMGAINGLTDLDIKGISDFYGQIGVSRFPFGGSYPIDCYLADAAAAMRNLGNTITNFVGNVNNAQAFHSNGNLKDGDGYFMPGSIAGSFLYYPSKVKKAYANWGPIRDKFTKMNYEFGQLGWPDATETLLPDGKGYFQKFDHGYIYWSPAHGAFVVPLDIFGAWAGTGWERGKLGYPTADALSKAVGALVLGNSETSQIFEGGIITISYSRNFNGQVSAATNIQYSNLIGNPYPIKKVADPILNLDGKKKN